MPLKNNFHIIHFNTIDSTNNYAKQHIHTLSHYDVIDTDHQTSGRGRSNHQWLTSPKSNLTMSIIIKDKVEPSKIQQLTQVTALAICQVCNDLGLYPKIKFPNDIYINDKKIAGILIETIYEHALVGIVIGVGLNVNEINLPDTATSLYNEGIHLSLAAVKNTYLHYFDQYYQSYQNGNYRELLKQTNNLSYLKDKEFIYKNQLVKVNELLENGQIELVINHHKEYVYINEFSLSK